MTTSRLQNFAPGAGLLTLVGSASVAGSAATNLTIAGLNLATDGTYLLEYVLKNATGSAIDIRLFYNGDTTTTNYYYQYLLGFGTSVFAQRANSPIITGIGAGAGTVNGQLWISLDRDGRARAMGKSNRDGATTLNIHDIAHAYNVVSNVTSLTISASVASALSVGDVIRVWKVSASSASVGNYTVPGFSQIASLLHFGGANGSTTFTDQVSGNVWTPTNATISTAQSLFGGSSALFVPSGNSAIKMPTNSNFNFGVGDWTIEMSLYPLGTHQSFAHLFQTRDGDVNSGVALSMESSGGQNLQLYMSSNGSTTDLLSATTVATLVVNQWTRILVQRKGTVLTSYFNGQRVWIGTISATTPLYYNAADSIILGGNATGTSRSFNGYVDEFRVTKGVALVTDYPLATSAFPDS